MATETLDFKITLSGTYWDKKPSFVIAVNGEEVIKSTISAPSGEHEVYEFKLDLDEDAEHVLSVSLEGKTFSDTVQNADKTEILKDMLLNIEQVEIDGINIGTLKWTHTEYKHDGEVETKTVNLGRNGSWELKFNLPFYIWMLENT